MLKTKVLLPINFSRVKEFVQYITRVCNAQVKILDTLNPQVEIFAENQERLQFSQNLALLFIGPEFETVIFRLSPIILKFFNILEIQRYFARRHRIIAIADKNGGLYMSGSVSHVEAIAEILTHSNFDRTYLNTLDKKYEFEQLCAAYGISLKKVRKKATSEEISFLIYYLPLIESRIESLDEKSSLNPSQLDAYRKPNGVTETVVNGIGTPNWQTSAILSTPNRQTSAILTPDKCRNRRKRNCKSTTNLSESPKSNGDRRSRTVVIDGANVAHGESTTSKFNLGNLRIALDYFLGRGITGVKIVLPESANECRRFFSEDEIQRHFVFTAVRRLGPGAKPQRADDDSVIIQMAMGLKGVVISNDRYRDFLARKPEAKDFLMNQVIPYNLSDGIFAISDYPLGMNHKTLDEILTYP